MHYLIEHFGLLPGWLLAAFAIFFRYLVFAGLAFLLFYRFGHTFFRHLKIQNRTAEQRHMLAEILHSGYSALIFGLIGVGLYFMRTAGYTEIYTDWNAYGAWYIPISFLLLLVLQDTYFYWVHRLMHHPRLFKRLHRVHHQSFNPTPWASLSFHPLEAIVEIAILPIAALIIPFHPLVLFLFATWSLLWNVLGHLGYEIFPAGFVHHPVFRWFNTSTHHNMHHERSGCNYGLYFNFWDTVMNTNHSTYHATFDRITAPEKQKEPKTVSGGQFR
jgi:sterol desaturase/sphingolipid hydroxylase (fatty acid hydroxylase superfamily)